MPSDFALRKKTRYFIIAVIGTKLTIIGLFHGEHRRVLVRWFISSSSSSSGVRMCVKTSCLIRSGLRVSFLQSTVCE